MRQLSWKLEYCARFLFGTNSMCALIRAFGNVVLNSALRRAAVVVLSALVLINATGVILGMEPDKPWDLVPTPSGGDSAFEDELDTLEQSVHRWPSRW